MFHSFLKDQYLRTLKELTTGSPVSDTARVRASKKQDLKLQIFLRRDSFEDAVKQLQQVRQFEYDILTPRSMTADLQPISDKLKLERRHLHFEAGVRGDSFLARIKNLIPTSPKGSQRFRVVGEDASGDRASIDLIAPPDHFTEDEFDDLADDEVLNLEDIESSSYITKLLHVFSTRRGLFTAKAPN